MSHISEIIEQFENESSTYYIPTFFEKLDKIFPGFGKGELTLIAGDKKAGSTALMLNIIYNILKNTESATGLITLDLSFNSTLEKVIKILDEEHDVNWLKKQALYIESPSLVYIQELYQYCLEMVSKYDLKAIFIDSFKSLDMRGEYYSEESQKKIINELTAKEVKKIARLLNIPLILTATLENTVVERTGEKRPHREDIPSGLDIYPDHTLLIYRPEMYGLIEDEEGASNKNIAEITKFISDVYQDESVKLKFENDKFSSI